MAREKNRRDRPSRHCIHCGLPFTWRKKWARCWDEVKYCSERCRRQSKATKNQQ